MKLARVGPLLIALCLGAAGSSSQQPDRTLNVTVNYTGAGAVDEAHKLFALVFETSYIGHQGVSPIASASVPHSGDSVTFELSTSPVYVEVFYDRAGACAADCPEPPSGSPAALYGAQPGLAEPIEIQKGERRRVSVSFDDSVTVP